MVSPEEMSDERLMGSIMALRAVVLGGLKPGNLLTAAQKERRKRKKVERVCGRCQRPLEEK